VRLHVCCAALIGYDIGNAVKDAISVADIIALMAASAGVLIVVGSLVLLYKGIITLQAVSAAARQRSVGHSAEGNQAVPGPHETAEVPAAVDFQLGEHIKIKSQYPALGLFILGIACFFGALWFDKANAPTGMDVQGKVVDSGKYTFTFTGMMGVARPDVNGFVHRVVPIDIDELDVQVAKGGSAPDIVVVYPSQRRNGTLSFGNYPTPQPSSPQAPAEKIKIPIPKPTVNPAQVSSAPANIVPLQMQ
jgi:hypothetical protein